MSWNHRYRARGNKLRKRMNQLKIKRSNKRKREKYINKPCLEEE